MRNKTIFGLGRAHLCKNVLESLRKEKARVLCEEQKSGVILPFLLKILQGRMKKLGERVPSDLRYVTKP